MATIFTKIINQEIPNFKIAEDDLFYAFLDICPLEKGHTLVVPKKEVDYIFDLEDELLAKFNVFSKKVALAIESVIDCKRIGIAVIGLEVAHAHIHLIPLYEDAINFSKPRLNIKDEELKAIAASISAKVSL
ncbi:MAG: HIT family protein [Chitinophagales bacterium]